MSNIKASERDIINYWYGKHILPDGYISQHLGSGIPILIDKGEINCWACDMPEEMCKLERCHILAESLGGEGHADNLFLLCEDCHREAPDTTNRDAFFRWVYKKRKSYGNGYPNANKMRELVDEELKDRGMMTFEELLSTLPEVKRKKLTHILSHDIFADGGLSKYVSKHVTVHFGTGKPNLNSLVIAIVDYILANYYKIVLETYEGQYGTILTDGD